MKYTVEIENASFQFDEKEIEAQNVHLQSADTLHMISDLKNYHVQLISMDTNQRHIVVAVNGVEYAMSIRDEYDQLLTSMGLDIVPEQKMTDVRAPMPGLVLDVMVKVGDEIIKGDQLVILEAMKMENVLQAEGDGVVKSIEVSKGDTVDKTQLLIEME